MVDIFEQLLSLILPQHKDAALVRAFHPRDITTLLSLPRHATGASALASYQEPVIRAAITRAKFAADESAVALLAALVDAAAPHLPPTDLIIPIPLSPHRLRERGYNQVLSVLSRATTVSDEHIATTILIRERDTVPQTSLGRHARLHNMKDAFAVCDADALAGKRVLLVDDVITTGATLLAARAALARHSPASITCVAFAH